MQRPFDPQLSYRLDAVIILLDYQPPWIVCLVLRLYKRYLERGI
jgi:hypothetical protein